MKVNRPPSFNPAESVRQTGQATKVDEKALQKTQESSPSERSENIDRDLELSKRASEEFRAQRLERAQRGEVPEFVKDASSTVLTHQLNARLDSQSQAVAATSGGTTPVNNSQVGSPVHRTAGAPGATAVSERSGPGAEPPKIDRSDMTRVDKFIVDKLNLDDVRPGESVTLEMTASASVAAILGVEAGTKLSVTATRDTQNPDQFTFSVGVGGELKGKVDAEAGAGGEAEIGVGGEAKIEFKMDLSKKGAATELAVFAGQSALISTSPLGGAMFATLKAAEGLVGRNLIDDPTDFLGKYMTSVELKGETSLTGELAAVLGPGLSAKVKGYLQGGVKLSFNTPREGQYTLSTGVAVGTEGVLQAAGGVEGAASAKVDIGGGKAELGFTQEIVLDREGREIQKKYIAQLELAGNIGNPSVNAGASVSLAIDLSSPAISPEIRSQMARALREGDLQRARELFQNNVLRDSQLTASVKVHGTTKVGGSIEIEPAGTGIQLGGSISNKRLLFEGQVSLSSQGITISNELARALGLPGQTTLTFDQFRQLFQNAPQIPTGRIIPGAGGGGW